jgi:hypothetical protein
VLGGITQTPGTPDVANQTAFANEIGAILGFPYSGGDVSGGIGAVIELPFFNPWRFSLLSPDLPFLLQSVSMPR